MAAKGTESKFSIFNHLQKDFPNAFWEDEGKILRIPCTENGEIIEIKVQLTAAKNILGSAEKYTAFTNEPAAEDNISTPPPQSSSSIDLTEEEKATVEKLLKNLNF